MSEQLEIVVVDSASVTLQKVGQAIDALAEKLTKFGSNTGLDKLAQAAQGLGGAPTTATESLGNAVGALSAKIDALGSSSSITKISEQLASIQSSNIITASAALTQLAEKETAATTATTGLTTAARAQSGALGSFGDSVRAITERVQAFASPVTGAIAATGSFGSAIASLANGIVEVGVAQLLYSIAGAITALPGKISETVKAFEKFEASMTAFHGSAQIAKDDFNFIRDLADKASLPLLTLAEGYRRLAATGAQTGVSLQTQRQLFQDISVGAAGAGISTQQFKGVILALDESMGRGYATGKELNRQFSNDLPGSLAAFRDALHMTTEEFAEAVKEHKIGTDQLVAGLDLYAQRMKVAQDLMQGSFTNSIARLGNAATVLETQFTSFFDAFAPGIQAVTDAISNPAITGALSGILDMVGQIVAVFGNLGQLAVAVAGDVLSLVSALTGGAIGQNWQGLVDIFRDLNIGIAETTFVVKDVGAAIVYYSNVVKWALGGTVDLTKAANDYSVALQTNRANLDNFIRRQTDAKNGIDDTSLALKKQAEEAGKDDAVVAALDKIKDSTDGVVTADQQATEASNTTADAYKRMGDAAALAAQQVASLGVARAGGGVAPSDPSVQGGTFALGGIAGQGSTTAMSAALFAGAPHFAGGTANTSQFSSGGGGFPAILHPNEAIVPLASGGRIPVALTGGGAAPAGADDATRKMSDLLEAQLAVAKLHQTKTEVQLDRQTNLLSLIAQGSASGTGSSAIAQGLSAGGTSGSGGPGVTTGVAGSAVAKGTTGLTNTGITANGGTGTGTKKNTGGGGGGAGGGAGNTWTSTDQTALDAFNAMALNAAADQYGATNGQVASGFTATLMNPGGSSDYDTYLVQNSTGNSVGVTSVGTHGIIPQQLTSLDQSVLALGESGARSKLLAGGPAALNAILGGQYFSKGSPNASRDNDGAFQAVLHPDEAVIPLADGRSVPVNLKGQQGGQITNHFAITIQTPDADSFKRSERQIMQQLQAGIVRATKEIGASYLTEDPTR